MSHGMILSVSMRGSMPPSIEGTGQNSYQNRLKLLECVAGFHSTDA